MDYIIYGLIAYVSLHITLVIIKTSILFSEVTTAVAAMKVQGHFDSWRAENPEQFDTMFSKGVDDTEGLRSARNRIFFIAFIMMAVMAPYLLWKEGRVFFKPTEPHIVIEAVGLTFSKK